MSQQLLKEMIEHSVHFGHKPEKWNPKMKPFIYTKRNNIHILDLEKTVLLLEKACKFLEEKARDGKTILLVSTKPQCKKIIRDAAEKCAIPYVTEHWMSGLLTNFETIRRRIKYFKDLQAQEKAGEFQKYTKHEAQKLRKTITKLEAAVGGVQELQRIPDVLVLLDTIMDKIAVREARKLKIPMVALVDSNADPSGIQYPIPGNDDAIRSLQFIMDKLSESIIKGKGIKKSPKEKNPQ